MMIFHLEWDMGWREMKEWSAIKPQPHISKLTLSCISPKVLFVKDLYSRLSKTAENYLILWLRAHVLGAAKTEIRCNRRVRNVRILWTLQSPRYILHRLKPIYLFLFAEPSGDTAEAKLARRAAQYKTSRGSNKRECFWFPWQEKWDSLAMLRRGRNSWVIFTAQQVVVTTEEG